MKKILLVENDGPSAGETGLFFLQQGFSVLHADNYRLASKLLIHQQPDLILCALHLPEPFPGLEELVSLAGEYRKPIIYFISPEADELECGLEAIEKLRIWDYLVTPLIPEVLVRFIRQNSRNSYLRYRFRQEILY